MVFLKVQFVNVVMESYLITKVSNGVMHRVNLEKIFTFFISNDILKENKKAIMQQDKDTKKRLNFTTIVNETKEIPKLVCQSAKNAPYVKYGTDNLFPEYIFELYNNSSQFNSIVETMKNYIMGSGISSNFPMKIVNRKGDSFENFIEKLIYDYLIFGSFSFQVTRNKLGNISELNWIDIRFVRTNEDEDKIYYSTEWSKGRRQPKVYNRFTIGSEFPTSIFYYKGRRTREVYGVPMYIASLTSLEISTQIPEYHLNNLTNGFHPSAIVNFCNGSNLSEDVMDEIEESIEKKFTGTKNASKILLSFNDDMAHRTTIERLPDDGAVDIYNTLKDNVEKDIYTAFRINKLLMGNSEESTGFNKQSYIESFSLYNQTVISPIQRELEEVINNVLGEGALHFNEFQINWSETGSDESTSNIIE